jgi:peptide deformylase
MWETMRDADGVGLAAPQVGVLRRALVIDVTEPKDDDDDDESAIREAETDNNSGDANAPGEPRSSAGGVSESGESRNSAGGERVGPSAELPVNAPGGALYELLNPEIIGTEGASIEREGCLSVPGVSGLVSRPERVTVKAFDRDGKELIVEGKGILAKALCHEIDHLDGVLFTDIAEETEDIVRHEPDSQEGNG